MIVRILLTSLLAISGNLTAAVSSITDIVYTNGYITATFTHDYCGEPHFQLKIEECWSGYPLSCRGSILPSEDMDQDCNDASKIVTKKFPIPHSYTDTAFLLKVKLVNGSTFNVTVSDSVQQPAVIRSIELIPATTPEGILTGYQYRAEIQLGTNQCYARGTEAFMESRIEGNKVVLQAYRTFAQIKNHFPCSIEEYKPITKIQNGFVTLDQRDSSFIVIKNLEKINQNQTITIPNEEKSLGH